MDLIQQVKGYSDSREEEEEEDEEAAIAVAAATTEDMMIPIPIPREESSSSIRLQQQQDEDSSNNLMMNQRKQKQQLELMDLSLGRSNDNNKNEEANFNQQGVVIGGGCGSSTTTTSTNNNNEGNSSSTTNTTSVEKEHMFDKVVTPSDVGKLNRLVIPKQHAEKYFPLDSSSNEKGLLLNFEDRNGKLWRFRYSYWNSSQSYVMTKGWSRFVKEKKLDSGDIVSFQRGVGDMYRHRLYIDWRRRPDHLHGHAHAHNPLLHHHHHDPNSPSTLFSPLFLPNQYSITWGGRLYSLPSPSSSSSSTSSTMLHHNHNYGSHVYNNAFHHHHQQQQQLQLNHHHQYYDGHGGSGLNYLRSTPSMSSMHQIGDQNFQERGNISPMIIDSVPVTHHHHQQQHQQHHGGIGTNTTTTPSSSNVGKRLRLFGVNMECASSSSMEYFNSNSNCLSTSTSAPLHVSMPNSSSLPSSSLRVLPYEDEDSSPTKGTTSVLFDLDPSLQYRQ